MYIERVTAESIAVSGTGNTATTTITVPDTFTPAAGCVYDILLSAQVPVATDGTIIAISNTDLTAELYQPNTGNYVRARGLGWRKVLRVVFFDDPEHFNLLAVRS